MACFRQFNCYIWYLLDLCQDKASWWKTHQVWPRSHSQRWWDCQDSAVSHWLWYGQSPKWWDEFGESSYKEQVSVFDRQQSYFYHFVLPMFIFIRYKLLLAINNVSKILFYKTDQKKELRLITHLLSFLEILAQKLHILTINRKHLEWKPAGPILVTGWLLLHPALGFQLFFGIAPHQHVEGKGTTLNLTGNFIWIRAHMET